ncbi:Recombinase (fragment) [Candidatus Sulfopaludibacter sp. SbA6]
MSGFLIDTNVLSELQPAGWSRRRREALDRDDRPPIRGCSVIRLAEIQKGIGLLADGNRCVQLEQWMKQDLEAYA